jgi:glyoxylase-like metal-dependent hydrolase (beta-lactamase superfamily II)
MNDVGGIEETLKLFLLRDGFFSLDKSLVVYMKYIGELYEAALKPLLILTDGGEKVLVDTGIGELPESHRRFFPVKRKGDETLTMQLMKHGLKPSDVDIVINTHLHFDHCGNNRMFKDARFVVQKDELQYAYEPERFQQATYARELFDIKGLNYETVRGRFQVCEGVTVIRTPGHSVGHQSVVVECGDDRNYVYCGDAAPIRENLERRNIPGILYNAHEALESIDILRKIEKAVYIYSHDNEQLTV